MDDEYAYCRIPGSKSEPPVIRLVNLKWHDAPPIEPQPNVSHVESQTETRENKFLSRADTSSTDSNMKEYGANHRPFDPQQDQLAKGASLNVLTTFQTPMVGRKHILVDYKGGNHVTASNTSVVDMPHYHEPTRLTSAKSSCSSSSNGKPHLQYMNGYSNGNHNVF